MEALRVFPPQDLQHTFDRSGHFWLYDFDHYGHVSTNGTFTHTASPKGDRQVAGYIRNIYYEVLIEANFRPTDGGFHVHLDKLRSELCGREETGTGSVERR